MHAEEARIGIHAHGYMFECLHQKNSNASILKVQTLLRSIESNPSQMLEILKQVNGTNSVLMLPSRAGLPLALALPCTIVRIVSREPVPPSAFLRQTLPSQARSPTTPCDSKCVSRCIPPCISIVCKLEKYGRPG